MIDLIGYGVVVAKRSRSVCLFALGIDAGRRRAFGAAFCYWLAMLWSWYNGCV